MCFDLCRGNTGRGLYRQGTIQSTARQDYGLHLAFSIKATPMDTTAPGLKGEGCQATARGLTAMDRGLEAIPRGLRATDRALLPSDRIHTTSALKPSDGGQQTTGRGCSIRAP